MYRIVGVDVTSSMAMPCELRRTLGGSSPAHGRGSALGRIRISHVMHAPLAHRRTSPKASREIKYNPGRLVVGGFAFFPVVIFSLLIARVRLNNVLYSGCHLVNACIALLFVLIDCAG